MSLIAVEAASVVADASRRGAAPMRGLRAGRSAAAQAPPYAKFCPRTNRRPPGLGPPGGRHPRSDCDA